MKTPIVAAVGLALATVLAPAAPALAQAPKSCEASAKTNIDFVVSKNVRYRRTFERAMKEGATPYEGILRAQRRNAAGLAALKACEDWSKSYLASLGFVAKK